MISVVAKIFEKVIYEQAYECFNESGLLSNHQSGFRSLYSTVTALLEATNSWSVNIDNGLLIGQRSSITSETNHLWSSSGCHPGSVTFSHIY